jgi:predicted esterase
VGVPALLDRLVALALPRRTFFRDGFGDVALLDGFDHRELLVPPAPAHLAWGDARAEGPLEIREAAFESPEPRLPRACRTARVRRLAPAAPRGEVVLLAASGDQGFTARTVFARALAREGVASWMLENPYYGARRPPGQVGAAVRTVSDLLLMAVATVRETLSLLALLRAGAARRIGVAGYSMGGNMAALVAGAAPFPIAAVAAAPSASAAPVFTEGVLRRYPDLRSLGDDERGAARALRDRLARFDATRLPPPRAPGACIVVGTRADGFVPPAEMERLAVHWGSELRWLDAGHISALLLHRPALRAAVVDALSRL